MGKEIFRRLVAPICVASFMAFFCQPLYLASDGECDYILLILLIGIPFGIGRMVVWFVPFRSSSIAVAAGVLALDILIGGLIGIFVFAFLIASGIWYLISVTMKNVIRGKAILKQEMKR